MAFFVFLIYSRKNNNAITNVANNEVSHAIKKNNFIDTLGDSISTRVMIPEGYQRVSYKKGSFQEYLRHYPLKPHGSKIIKYDKTEFFAQNWHEAILEIPIPINGLQQCADALMRIRSEYLWLHNRKDEIGFNFTSGHYCSWKKYAEGYRPTIKGNKVSFHKKASKNDTKNNFYKYLNLIYMYAGTLSMYNELEKVPFDTIRIGDMLVKPGTPGHIEIIVDEIINEQGKKMYLLAQGYTPSQSVCLLKNHTKKEISPWYIFEKDKPIDTPGYYFEKPIFIRFK